MHKFKRVCDFDAAATLTAPRVPSLLSDKASENYSQVGADSSSELQGPVEVNDQVESVATSPEMLDPKNVASKPVANPIAKATPNSLSKDEDKSELCTRVALAKAGEQSELTTAVIKTLYVNNGGEGCSRTSGQKSNAKFADKKTKACLTSENESPPSKSKGYSDANSDRQEPKESRSAKSDLEKSGLLNDDEVAANDPRVEVVSPMVSKNLKRPPRQRTQGDNEEGHSVGRASSNHNGKVVAKNDEQTPVVSNSASHSALESPTQTYDTHSVVQTETTSSRVTLSLAAAVTLAPVTPFDNFCQHIHILNQANLYRCYMTITVPVDPADLMGAIALEARMQQHRHDVWYRTDKFVSLQNNMPIP
ncbi:hypothetical protein BG000_003989 [Podila horticola]|nr:hypothetical protein BG000_003989 [Podila horticola]